MKIVKEQLYEKFTEDSDPIKDMGIGQVLKCKKSIFKSTYKSKAFTRGKFYKIVSEDESLISLLDNYKYKFTFTKHFNSSTWDYYFIKDYFYDKQR